MHALGADGLSKLWSRIKSLVGIEVEASLTEAKESGEFDGEPGKTPVKGEDYFTEADIAECAEAAANIIAASRTVSYTDPTGPIPITNGTQILFYANRVGKVTLHLGTKTYSQEITDTSSCVWLTWVQSTETGGSVITTQGKRTYLSVGGILSEMTVDYNGTGSVVVLTIG